ncbi:DUF1629 domain-containing protein [Phyllobacterium sp. 0TCS1.6C]|uniref:imm11 family protein n=1 Tax=unclassified Phyllobacterium TaxID=2638441 RepID=UPI002264E9D6|nr:MULTISPECIES: DUF1629 domain-containing protein [unclassified Phyllobacterium]MCX8281898.1 DUF1629 domain-containing protein [Phyllobacterium sp. 0TCS1.6C]MCX8295433.1 DUF1629 domain-containing protein [Phyllobacterium sp. 0TCS1.6A]
MPSTFRTARPTSLSSAKQERLKARKFFTIGHDYRGGGKGPGIKLINGKALITTGMTMFCPPRGRRGFALPLAETPHFIEEKGYRPTRDLEANGFYWFISQRTKEVFESVDPEGFAFVPCDFTLPDGSKGDPRYLCDVIRELDAIDEEKSKVKVNIEPSGRKIYHVMGGGCFSIRDAEVGYSHVFSDVHYSGLICDDVLRDACKSAKLTGILFRDTADL